MKHHILSVAAAAAMALGLGSCHDDCQIKEAEATGSLSFASMSVDVSVAENVMRTVPALHKAPARSTVDVSDFLVTIKKADGETTHQWKYASMPEIMTLEVGTGYTVEVKSHEVQKAEWARPYYLGTKTFDITDSEVTEIGTVVCRLANIKVTIKFADELLAQLGADAVVNVLANDEGSLDFTPSETRSGYFAAIDGSSTLVATFTGTVGGHPERIQRTLTDVAAGQHRIITFKLKPNNQEPDPETGTINPDGIGVDLEVESEDLNGDVTIDEDVIVSGDRPDKEGDGQEEPPTPPTPPAGDEISFDSEYLDLEGVNKASEFGDGLKPAVVLIKSKNPIENLKIAIDSESLTEDLLTDVGLAKEFDLANPGQFAEGLTGLGLPNGADVKGKTEVTFDITGFMTLLCIYPDAISKFIITLTDNTGASAEQSITFTTHN